MKRKLRNILIALTASAVLAAAVFFGGGAVIAALERRKPLRLPEAATLVPPAVARPGDPALAVLEFALPWGVAVAEARAATGEDAAVSGAPRISSEWRWGRRLWRVETTLRPLSSRGVAPGRLELTLDRALPGAESGRCEVALPALKVSETAAAVADRPLLAGPEELSAADRVRWRWIVAGAAAVAAVVSAAVLLLRRGARRPVELPPPWEVARTELAGLRAAMAKRGFRTESGVAALSDILRNYLAARFGLPAATEAGYAFLDEGGRFLTAEELEFLRGFFAAAEPVKFARAAADRSALELAVAAASRLVERTVPPPPEKSRKEAGS